MHGLAITAIARCVMYASVCVYIYIYMYIYIYIYLCIYVYLWIRISQAGAKIHCICKCTYPCIHTCMCVYIYIYVFTYVCMYIYTYICVSLAVSLSLFVFLAGQLRSQRAQKAVGFLLAETFQCKTIVHPSGLIVCVSLRSVCRCLISFLLEGQGIVYQGLQTHEIQDIPGRLHQRIFKAPDPWQPKPQNSKA